MSPLDYAVKFNQITVCQLIVDFVNKHYADPLFNFMFDKNFINLLRMNVSLNDYGDNIAYFKIPWPIYPTTHQNDVTLIRGYNKPIKYLEFENVFKELDEAEIDNTKPSISIEYHVINMPSTLNDNKL